MAMPRVAFVGPLPPPVHGFSNICAAMLELLRKRSPVEVFDRAPHPRGGLFSVLKPLQLLAMYFGHSLKNPHAKLYIALSGGTGQLLDLPFVAVAKLFGQGIFVHHHSFAYIDRPSILNRMMFALLGNACHIVLSERMGAALAGIYRLNGGNVRVISNAAFYDSSALPHVAQRDETALQIGYLSTVSEAKGIVQYFAVLKELKARGVPYQAKIAGPLEADSKVVFEELLAEASEVEYCGPLYDEAKQKFYDALDVLMFPTNYVNEAEPLVIHEAMRRGVHVLACKRGAIEEILSNGAGEAVAYDEFVEMAAGRLQRFDLSRAELQRAQGLSFEQARRLRAIARVRLGEFLTEISGIPYGYISA